MSPSPQFNCSSDAACIATDGTHGSCRLSGNCAFPDPSCGDQGLRYDDSAAPGRVHVCVLSPSGASMVSPQLVSPDQLLLFEITTPPQPIVFDTEVGGTNALVQLHWFAGSCPPVSPTELPSMSVTCGNPVAARISVTAGTPGSYCLVATDVHAGSDATGLRVFPNLAPPSCVE